MHTMIQVEPKIASKIATCILSNNVVTSHSNSIYFGDGFIKVFGPFFKLFDKKWKFNRLKDQWSNRISTVYLMVWAYNFMYSYGFYIERQSWENIHYLECLSWLKIDWIKRLKKAISISNEIDFVLLVLSLLAKRISFLVQSYQHTKVYQ